MILPGLVSVTFRKLAPAEIISLAATAGLRAIEWGGDVHVPAGRVDTARRVGYATRGAGLEVACYGSYYRAGESEEAGFQAVLDTADALGAPCIRVWAGARGSAACDEAYRKGVVEDATRIGEMAQGLGIQIVFEYHGKTLTDSNESALRLLRETGHPNVKTLWQPSLPGSVEDRAAGLSQVLPWLVNLHVYHWTETEPARRALSEGEPDWKRYLRAASGSGRNHYALLEFVRDDAVECFREDAQTLNSWLQKL